MRKRLSIAIGTFACVIAVCLAQGHWHADQAKPNDAAALSEHLDQELATWVPDHDDLRPIIGEVLRPASDIAGDWTAQGVLDGSVLAVRRNESGRYSIGFLTFGCLGGWGLERRANYTDGILRLDRPVKDYRSNTYDTLYVVSIDGTEYLVSQSSVRHAIDFKSQDGIVDWKELKFLAFHRKQKQDD